MQLLRGYVLNFLSLLLYNAFQNFKKSVVQLTWRRRWGPNVIYIHAEWIRKSLTNIFETNYCNDTLKKLINVLKRRDNKLSLDVHDEYRMIGCVITFWARRFFKKCYDLSNFAAGTLWTLPINIMKVWTRFSWLKLGTSEQCNEPSDSVKSGKIVG